MKTIDELVYQAVFGKTNEEQQNARIQIRETAKDQGIYTASIHNLYMSFATGKIAEFSVPACNIRNLTYEMARLIFRLLKEAKTTSFIFEIARGEVTYTNQTHDEYASVVLAAAIAEQWRGPVYLQADHSQFSAPKYKETPEIAIQDLKTLIKQAIDAGFYNIDIDASTLVDLTKQTVPEQQEHNYKMTALLTRYIREIEPEGITVSIGGEIGHIGGKNSTVEDFKAFMEGFKKEIGDQGLATGDGLSKISVQTGSSHGGTMLPDGSMKQVSIDFDVHATIGQVAREQYHMGGTVQHGASTLPISLFHRFVASHVVEVHLATGFQNIMFDHFPDFLKNEIKDWVMKNCANERKPDWNDEQFVYALRKKANGPFKQKIWGLTAQEKQPILSALEYELRQIFEQLGIHRETRSV